MLKAANCKTCGKVFLKSINEVCPECIKKEQDLLKGINDYCYSRTSVSLHELAHEFDESVAKLEKYLLERKLVQVMDKLDLICRGCGVHYTILNEGRLYCKSCFDKLELGLLSVSLDDKINPYTGKPFYNK